MYKNNIVESKDKFYSNSVYYIAKVNCRKEGYKYYFIRNEDLSIIDNFYKTDDILKLSEMVRKYNESFGIVERKNND